MIYLIGAIAILANIFFYIFLKFSLWILFFNILIFFIFIILIKSHKEYQNLESKKKLITNYNTELGKNDLERLFIDKIEDGIIILNVLPNAPTFYKLATAEFDVGHLNWMVQDTYTDIVFAYQMHLFEISHLWGKIHSLL